MENSIKYYKDIKYSSSDSDKLLLDVFSPAGACQVTLMWIHGGGLEYGNKDSFAGIGRQLAEKGIAFVPINYSMYPNAKFPEFIEDAAKATNWILNNASKYNISSNLIIGGSSAGAYISMMLCFNKAYLNKYKIEDKVNGYIFNAGQPTTHFNVLKYSGKDSRLCIIDEMAPLYYINESLKEFPILIIVADDDIACRLEQNLLLKATLKHFNYNMDKVHLLVMEGYTHCGYDELQNQNGQYILANVIKDFIDNYICQ